MKRIDKIWANSRSITSRAHIHNIWSFFFLFILCTHMSLFCLYCSKARQYWITACGGLFVSREHYVHLKKFFWNFLEFYVELKLANEKNYKKKIFQKIAMSNSPNIPSTTFRGTQIKHNGCIFNLKINFPFIHIPNKIYSTTDERSSIWIGWNR